MKTSAKLVLAALGSAALLAGCATGPYYDNYGYGNDPYGRGYYGYDYGYPYVAPSIGLGFSYSDRYDRRWRDGDGRDRDGWRDRDGSRDGWRDRDGSRDRDGNWRDHRGPRDDNRGGN